MFRAGHKERRERLTVITRFRGAANREERRNWKAASEQGRSRQVRTLFLSLSRLCFRTVPETDAFVRRQWRDCLASSTFLPTIRRFLRDLSTQAFQRCLLTKTLLPWRRFPFLSLVSANGMGIPSLTVPRAPHLARWTTGAIKGDNCCAWDSLLSWSVYRRRDHLALITVKWQGCKYIYCSILLYPEFNVSFTYEPLTGIASSS